MTARMPGTEFRSRRSCVESSATPSFRLSGGTRVTLRFPELDPPMPTQGERLDDFRPSDDDVFGFLDKGRRLLDVGTDGGRTRMDMRLRSWEGTNSAGMRVRTKMEETKRRRAPIRMRPGRRKLRPRIRL